MKDYMLRPKEIKEGNDLICNFMDNNEAIRAIGIRGKYHESWDALTPVIAKLNPDMWEDEKKQIWRAWLDEDIETAYRTVVSVIMRLIPDRVWKTQEESPYLYKRKEIYT